VDKKLELLAIGIVVSCVFFCGAAAGAIAQKYLGKWDRGSVGSESADDTRLRELEDNNRELDTELTNIRAELGQRNGELASLRSQLQSIRDAVGSAASGYDKAASSVGDLIKLASSQYQILENLRDILADNGGGDPGRE